MDINLEDCIQKTSKEYLELETPVFKGQTRPDDKGIYWMVFESKGILYKFQHKS